MDTNRVTIAALLFIVAVIAINFAMVIVARTWAKGSDSSWMSAIRDALSKPTESSANRSMDELRKKMEELRGNDEEDM